MKDSVSAHPKLYALLAPADSELSRFLDGRKVLPKLCTTCFTTQLVMGDTEYQSSNVDISNSGLPESKTTQQHIPHTTIIDPHGDLTLEVGSGNGLDASTCSFLVCSRALARASPVFERMLFGSLAESQSQGKATKQWVVALPADDPSATETFCWISHGVVRKITKTMTRAQLVGLTLLTHYYDATEVLTPWLGRWLASIPEPATDDELELFENLWTCYELGLRRTFESTARRLVLDCPISLERVKLDDNLTSHLSDIISRVDAIRLETIDSMLDLLRDLTDILVVVDEKPRWCRYASHLGPHRCESMILGSVVFCLTRANLWPIPGAQDICENQSVMSLYKQLVNIVIHDIGQPEKNGGDHAKCNPRGFLLEQLQKVLADMADPLLEGQRGHVEDQHARLHSYI